MDGVPTGLASGCRASDRRGSARERSAARHTGDRSTIGNRSGGKESVVDVLDTHDHHERWGKDPYVAGQEVRGQGVAETSDLGPDGWRR